MTDKLISSIRDWIRILKPIQINFERRGLVHSQSRNLAIVVRTLVGNLSNLDIDLALEILVELKQLFTEVSEIKDLISQDIKALTFAGAKIKVKKLKLRIQKSSQKLNQDINQKPNQNLLKKNIKTFLK